MKLTAKTLSSLLFLLCCVTGIFAQNSDILSIVKVAKFGLDKKGDETIFDVTKWFCISNDGHIFVANGHQHNICKFTLDGKFIKRFGQKGEGPGDLYHPGNLSILDNKYILVREYAARRRIIMFDLNGKFAKIIRTERSVDSIGCLGKNVVLYRSGEFEKDYNQFFVGRYNLITIKNISSGKEILVDKTFITPYMYTNRKNLAGYTLDGIRGEILASTREGRLYIAHTDKPVIKVYTSKAKLIREIILKISKKLVTNKIISDYKKLTIDNWIDEMKNDNIRSKNSKRTFINSVKSMPYEKFFNKYLPCYDLFLVDRNGDIIIIANIWWGKDKGKWVRLYSSKDGSLIKQKKYIDKRYIFDYKKLVYSPKYGLYGFFQKRDSEDVDIRIVKLDWD